MPVPPPWSEGDCLADLTFGVGQPLQENATVFSGYGDYVYVLDAASAAAVRDLGYVLSEDGTMVSGSARKSGSIVITIVGTAPDGSVVRYRAKLNIVENQSARRVAEAVASGEKVMSPPQQEPPNSVPLTAEPVPPLDESVTPDTESDEPSSEPSEKTTVAPTPDPVQPKDSDTTGDTSEVNPDPEPADETDAHEVGSTE